MHVVGKSSSSTRGRGRGGRGGGSRIICVVIKDSTADNSSKDNDVMIQGMDNLSNAQKAALSKSLTIAICTTLSTFQKHTISATLQGMLRMLRCKRTTCSFDDALESPTDILFVFVVVVSLYGNILYLLKTAVVLDMHLEWS